MDSKAKFLGHPVHPMLIVFPLGLLGMAVIFDIIALSRGTVYLFNASYWMIAAGVISGAIAAIFGLVDWLVIPTGTRARSIGLWHGVGNAVVVLFFGLSWLLRRGSAEDPSAVALTLSFTAFVLALVTGWMGGELVDRLGVGVDTGANLNAPNSLTRRPASEAEDRNQLKRAA